MIDTYKELIANQYEAVFCLLSSCIDKCPEENWDAPVANLKFCQVVFHTLFCADIYLGPNFDALRGQPFHADHLDDFADYEELEEVHPAALYRRSFIREYLTHCREKASSVVAAETVETLEKMPGFDWLKFSRAEVHVYNIRHIHHHGAQLSLRLRIDHATDVPWFGSKWKTKLQA